jgi:cell division protein ZapA
VSTTSVPVSITILDKEYTVSCPEGEKEALLASARMLNERMRQVRDAGKVLGTERMAVMAALNLVHELGQEREDRDGDMARVQGEVRRIEQKISHALGRRPRSEGVD